jgi:hypothetical protein
VATPEKGVVGGCVCCDTRGGAGTDLVGRVVPALLLVGLAGQGLGHDRYQGLGGLQLLRGVWKT